MTNEKLMRKAVNARKLERGEMRANATECRVYSDSVRDAGDDALADLWLEVADFLDVWSAYLEADGWKSMHTTLAIDRRMFIAIDNPVNCEGTSGKFLLEKATGHVWSIRGYGKKNRIVALSLRDLADTYRDSLDQMRQHGRTV